MKDLGSIQAQGQDRDVAMKELVSHVRVEYPVSDVAEFWSGDSRAKLDSKIYERDHRSRQRPSFRCKTVEMVSHILYESATGYSLFKVNLFEEIASQSAAGQRSITDYAKFSKAVSFESSVSFKSAAQALENVNDISEGV